MLNRQWFFDVFSMLRHVLDIFQLQIMLKLQQFFMFKFWHFFNTFFYVEKSVEKPTLKILTFSNTFSTSKKCRNMDVDILTSFIDIIPTFFQHWKKVKIALKYQHWINIDSTSIFNIFILNVKSVEKSNVDFMMLIWHWQIDVPSGWAPEWVFLIYMTICTGIYECSPFLNNSLSHIKKIACWNHNILLLIHIVIGHCIRWQSTNVKLVFTRRLCTTIYKVTVPWPPYIHVHLHWPLIHCVHQLIPTTWYLL